MFASLPDTARLRVKPSLAHDLLGAAERLPRYDNREFYSPQLQSMINEALREETDGFDSLIAEIETRLQRWPYCVLVQDLSFDEGNKVFVGLNRAFVAKGLIAMRRRDHVGHTALMDVSRLNGPPEAWHLGFMLGPRINAGGRIGRADLGVRLLLEADVSEAARIAAELDRLNTERRVIEQMAEAQAEAEALASLGLEDKGSVIVTASEGWHPGVVGLVASRLREKFSRPAFAIALEPGGIGTGSGRSISGVDLGKAVRQAVKDGLLMKGGGHAMAAGVTLRKERLAEFRAYMESALAHDVANSRHENELFIDGAVSARAVTPELVATLNRAGPFGSGNSEPVVALPSHQLVYADEVGQAHLRVRFKSGDGAIVNGVAFRSIGQKLGNALIAHRGQPLHVAGSLAVDRWQGSERVQMRVIDVAVPDQGPTVIR